MNSHTFNQGKTLRIKVKALISVTHTSSYLMMERNILTEVHELLIFAASCIRNKPVSNNDKTIAVYCKYAKSLIFLTSAKDSLARKLEDSQKN